MSRIFDYIYYRLNRFYYKWDGENGSTSVIGLSMVQSMTVGNIFIIFLRLIFTKSVVQNFTKPIIIGVIILLVFFVILNFIFYKNKYTPLSEYWKNETIQKKRIHGFLVVLALIFPWVILCLIGYVNSLSI